MRAGSILQLGKPLEIYHAPVDRFVGGFIGNPPMNFVTATIAGSDGRLEARLEGAGAIEVERAHQEQLRSYVDRPVTLGIRAENIEIVPPAEPGDEVLAARVLVVEPLGPHDLLTVSLAGEHVKVQTRPDVGVRPHDQVGLRFQRDRITWLDPDSGRSVG
jgi:multiple sugar transport system ATP-binding protein